MPGAVDAWWTLHQRYGKLPWADLFAPAIALAANGAPVPDIIAYYIRRSMVVFKRPGNGIEETANALGTYGMAGRHGAAGGRGVPQPRSRAHLFRRSRRADATLFYTGDIAHAIDRYFKRIGGWLRYEDMAQHHSEWVEPYSTRYRGIDVVRARCQYAGHRHAADAEQ